MIENFVKDFNTYEPNKNNWKEVHRIKELHLEKVYNFLIEKRIVADRQYAMRLVNEQIGFSSLSNPNHMCYEEFNRLFCKGMFKRALINILEHLQKKSKSGDDDSPSSKANSSKDLFS